MGETESVGEKTENWSLGSVIEVITIDRMTEITGVHPKLMGTSGGRSSQEKRALSIP
jgi:hypothetical protein